MSRRFLCLFLIAVLVLSTSLCAGERILRKKISHSRNRFTDSKNYNERITMPSSWRKSNYVFTRFELVPTKKVMVLNPNLSRNTFTFTFRLVKNFAEKANGSLTVLLFANNNGQKPIYPTGPVTQPSTKNWYYPGQSYIMPVDRTRKIKKVKVSGTDMGGNARWRLYVDNKAYGYKSISNYDTDEWTVNRYANQIRVQVDRDAVQINNVQVIYYNNNYNPYPNNPYNPNPNNPYNPYPTNPTNPYYPNNPYQPSYPNNPYQPSYPNNPYNPYQPSYPYNPAPPNYPTNPTTNPTQPPTVNPQPTPTPTTPTTPTQPSNPVTPTPAPSTPNNPTNVPGGGHHPGSHTPHVPH